MKLTRALSLILAIGATLAASAAVAEAEPAPDVASSPAQVCARRAVGMTCLAERTPLSVSKPATSGSVARQHAAKLQSYAYGPADLRAAYRVPTSTTTATVAIVDAYDAPRVESDLNSYRAHYGLSPCTRATGCFRKVNQTGAAAPLPTADADWAGETTLDVEMVSAICPSCHILLVEARTDDRYGASDLEHAVVTATKTGAHFVSMSWGGSETPDERSADAATFTRSGVAYVAAAGDDDYGTGWPAANPRVVSVGGTSLTRSSSARGWAESVWGYTDGSGTGSGCSRYEQRPSWQAIAPITSLCAHRALNDVSVVGDPNTGVSVYQGGSWWIYGGTSVGAPMIAAMYAIAGTPSATPASAYPYAHRASFNDVSTNANGRCGTALCRGAAGWDGPTGVGTPKGVSGLRAPTTR